MIFKIKHNLLDFFNFFGMSDVETVEMTFHQDTEKLVHIKVSSKYPSTDIIIRSKPVWNDLQYITYNVSSLLRFVIVQ